MASKLDPLFEAAVKELPGIAAVIVDSSGKSLYSKAFGVTNVLSPTPTQYTTSTPTMIWSCTKLITSIAALQLVEQGKLSVSDLAEKYVPEIADIPVLDPNTKDSEGRPATRPAKTKATILQLFTHTAGHTYDFFDPPTLDWVVANGQTPHGHIAGPKESFTAPLGFDPGEKYRYGVNIDWLGFVVEAISGQSLDKYVEENITKPLGMTNTTAHFKSDADTDRLFVHLNIGGQIVSNGDFKPPPSVEKYGGGHFLTSTIDDYTKILVTLLDGGTHPTSGVQILSKATVSDYVFHDFIPEATKNSSLSPADAASEIGVVGTANPMLTATGRWLPDTELGWSCGLMINNDAIPGGRSAGSGSWAGMGNVYYWIDPKGDCAGMVMTSLLPFFDPRVLELFHDVESVAYGGDKGGVKAFTAP